MVHPDHCVAAESNLDCGYISLHSLVHLLRKRTQHPQLSAPVQARRWREGCQLSLFCLLLISHCPATAPIFSAGCTMAMMGSKGKPRSTTQYTCIRGTIGRSWMEYGFAHPRRQSAGKRKHQEPHKTRGNTSTTSDGKGVREAMNYEALSVPLQAPQHISQDREQTSL